MVKVSGAVQIDQEVPINAKASFGDGEMTWLQFGVSGAAEPERLGHLPTIRVGITLGKGRFSCHRRCHGGETPQCSGKTEVTETSVSGHYTCPGIVSHDAATGKMGKIDIEIRFTAKS